MDWPFREPFRSYSVTKSSIDFSRLIVVLLAANVLPAVILWRSEEIGEGLRRHESQLRHDAKVIIVLVPLCLLLIAGSALYEETRRVRRTASGDGAGVINPPPAPVIHPAGTPSSSTSTTSIPTLPPGFVLVETAQPALEATPTPVRRAIPVTK